jgi:hypothetical protein
MNEKKINDRIYEVFEDQNIGVNSGLLCLLGIYYNVDYEAIYDACPLIQVTVKQLNASGIFEYDIKNENIIWYTPLFENQIIQDNWSWLYDYQKLFRDIRKDTAGTYDMVKKKMIKFFIENPSVRSDEVIAATKAYIDTINDAKYLQRADYFIKKNGPDGQSRLKEFLEMNKFEPSTKTFDMM